MDLDSNAPKRINEYHFCVTWTVKLSQTLVIIKTKQNTHVNSTYCYINALPVAMKAAAAVIVTTMIGNIWMDGYIFS